MYQLEGINISMTIAVPLFLRSHSSIGCDAISDWLIGLRVAGEGKIFSREGDPKLAIPALPSFYRALSLTRADVNSD